MGKKRKHTTMDGLEVRDLSPADWPRLEQLFGANGACGGCWCMHWRHGLGEKWEDVKGDENRRRLRALVKSGKALGALAYADDEPVGWVAYGPRRDFQRLDRAPSLACDDADDVWSIPCFFIPAAHRGRGVATALLAHAVASISRRGGRIAEGYPTVPASRNAPAAFIWTGVPSLFTRAGFRKVAGGATGKQRMRRTLARARG